MTSLLPLVTPLTKGLLWFTEAPVTSDKSFYGDVDYLLNGLLTATLKSSESVSAHVLVGENFGNPFYVVVATNMTEKEISSYFDLVKSQIGDEGHLLLIDENGLFPPFQKLLPAELRSKIQVLS